MSFVERGKVNEYDTTHNIRFITVSQMWWITDIYIISID